MKFNLKKILKTIKLNEENISMVLGAIVLVIVGVLIVNYFKDKEAGSITESSTQITAANEHTVIKGETLWSIAENSYGSGYNWVDIKNANSLTSDDIEVGQKLFIPNDIEVDEPTTTEVIESAVITLENDENNQVITGDTYTVVKGDCLWDIAVRAYGDGYAWTEIAEANELTSPDIIHSGNILILPR